MEYTQILQLIKQKDKAGLEGLYNSYGKKFYNYSINRWKLNEDAGWDVVYQTFETLVLKLPSYEFESKQHFENFIFKVFTNFLRQHFRKHRKNQYDEIEFVSNDSEDDYSKDDPDLTSFQIENESFNDYYKSEVIENPKLRALNKALEQLDDDERSLLLLRAQNYSYEEIAKMLHIENKQLKVKYHRSKAKLVKLINKNPTDHV